MNKHDPQPEPRTGLPGSEGEHQVQRELGTADRAARFYEDQMRDRLNSRMREFVARQEMLFLSTASADGECDSTFRAGPPGFLRVLDDRTIAYPEYRGNGVMASLGNIKENPHVGILMIDFGRDRIGLHINGRAQLVSDEMMRFWRPELPVDPVPGRRPQVWVEVNIEEAYIHCSKHIPHLVKAPAVRADALPGPDGERAWGTDDVKRKGGDFFGAAAERRAEGGRSPRARKPRDEAAAPAEVAPAPGDDAVQPSRALVPAVRRPTRAAGPHHTPGAEDTMELTVWSRRTDRAAESGLPDPEVWRLEAERALARARQGGEDLTPRARSGAHGGGFRGWFG